MPVLPRSLSDVEEQLIVLQTPEPSELEEVTQVVARAGGQISQVKGLALRQRDLRQQHARAIHL